jgi:hypothetical protein
MWIAGAAVPEVSRSAIRRARCGSAKSTPSSAVSPARESLAFTTVATDRRGMDA